MDLLLIFGILLLIIFIMVKYYKDEETMKVKSMTYTCCPHCGCDRIEISYLDIENRTGKFGICMRCAYHFDLPDT